MHRSIIVEVLLYTMSNGDTYQNGGIESIGLLRHKDVAMCGMNAMASCFFWQ